MGFSLSQSLSLYLKNESENVKWNESLSLSLFKTLSLSLWTVIQWLADCFCLPLLYNFINIFLPLFLALSIGVGEIQLIVF